MQNTSDHNENYDKLDNQLSPEVKGLLEDVGSKLGDALTEDGIKKINFYISLNNELNKLCNVENGKNRTDYEGARLVEILEASNTFIEDLRQRLKALN